MDVAALTQQLSIAAFAREQRRLISVDGGQVSVADHAGHHLRQQRDLGQPAIRRPGGGLTMLFSVVPATAIVVGLRNPALRVRVGANWLADIACVVAIGGIALLIIRWRTSAAAPSTDIISGTYCAG